MFVEQTERKVERKCTVFIKIHPRIPDNIPHSNTLVRYPGFFIWYRSKCLILSHSPNVKKIRFAFFFQTETES